MGAFRTELAARATDPAGRRWLFVPYDQLTDAVGPLAREDPHELGIVVVETRWKPRRRPYHRQKLALVLASLRHFALEQAERGIAVRHVTGDAPYGELLAPVARELGPLRAMRPAERELRADLAPLVKQSALELVPHEGWITSEADFDAAFSRGQRWRMDVFYRHVRRAKGVLMDGDAFAGGQLSFDASNREPWRGEPAAPKPPRFATDPIKQEVVELVEQAFAAHPGTLDADALPATAADAKRAWRWARRHCLEHFGPYEDAMSQSSRTLFHTQISPLLNNLRLLARDVVADVAAMDLPIESQEGFVRQVLGWREFVRHVHERTDGFRALPDGTRPKVVRRPGDAGFARWSEGAWPRAEATRSIDGGACPSALDASAKLPDAYWGAPSGLACLDRVVADVWETGYGHHITRLMVLSNLATLLGVAPREVADWFWAAYTDAYDWVVEPNVLGMGTFGLGELFTTKPYVSGAAYIDRMSDYCAGCAFSPKRDCPITPMYWSFLERNEPALRDNARVAMSLRSLAKRSKSQRAADRAVAEWASAVLARGERLCPEERPDAADAPKASRPRRARGRRART